MTAPAPPVSRLPAANVAQMPQRSPLRYPGGKTWLIPHIREWLVGADADTIIEPFAGGATASLTAVFDGLVRRAVLYERDPDVAAFWHAVTHHAEGLVFRINALGDKLSREYLAVLERTVSSDAVNRGFRTLVLNRTRRGGVLAAGASMPRKGEGGRGVASRWYPDTMVSRIRAIEKRAGQFLFFEGDGVAGASLLLHTPGAAFFLDPPYPASGRRLYTYNHVAPIRLFDMMAGCRAPFMFTCDASPENIEAAHARGFHAVTVEMKTGHHARAQEIIVTRRRLFA